MKQKVLRQAIILILVLLCQSIVVHADGKGQTVTLWGHVRDAFSNTAVKDVKITLMDEDSIIIDTQKVQYFDEGKSYMDSYYKFEIPAQPKRYIIRAERDGYETCYVNLNIKYIGRNTYFDARWHYMNRKVKTMTGKELDEVAVTATRVKIVFRNDTVVYNADAFNVPTGSMLDDLIRQLPGVTLNTDGQIFMNGRKVDNLLLQGRDFSRKDPNQLLRNLPAYTVNNVRFYEKDTDKNKYLGYSADTKPFVLDVGLKREYARGYLANAEVGGGTNERYDARAFALRYTPHSRFSLYGNINNVNEYHRPGSDGEWRETNLNIGQMASKQLGMSWSTGNSDESIKNDLSANAQWRLSDNQTIKSTENFLTDGNTHNLSEQKSNADMALILATNDFSINKSCYFTSRTFLNYNNVYDSHQSERTATFSRSPFEYGDTRGVLDGVFNDVAALQQDLVNSSKMLRTGKGYRLDVSQDFSLTKKLPWGDDIDFGIGAVALREKNDAFYNYDLLFKQQEDKNELQQQYEHETTKGYNYHIDADYNIHLLNNWNYRFNYSYEQNYRRRPYERYRLDRIPGWTEGQHAIGDLPSTRDELLFATDMENSYFSRKLSRDHSVGVNILYDHETDSINRRFEAKLYMKYAGVRMNYQRNVLDTIARRNDLLLNPSVGYTWSTKAGYRFYVGYKFSMMTPDILETIGYTDTSNPLVVRKGNKDLRNSKSHEVNIEFSGRATHQSLYNISLNANFDDDLVGNSSLYDPKTGIRTYQPRNVSGNWMTSLGGGYTTAIGAQRLFSWEANINATYNHNVDFIGSTLSNVLQLSKVDNLYVKHDQKLSFQKGKLRCALVGSVAWHGADCKDEGFVNRSVWDFDYGTTVVYTMPWDINLSTDMKMYSRSGYEDTLMNYNRLVWNASLAKSILKASLTFRLTCYDLLHKISNTNYEVNAQGRTETWNNAIPNYIMLSIGYKLHIKP